MKLVLPLVAALLAAGCAAPAKTLPPEQLSDSQWGAQIERKSDPYTKVTLVQGGDLKSGQSSVHLRAALTEGRPDISPKIALYASLFYFDKRWHYYDSANTIDGRSWPTKSSRRDVFQCMSQNCSYGELVLVDMDADYLRSKSAEGVNIKIWGSGGAEEFRIPPAYIVAFLAEIPR